MSQILNQPPPPRLVLLDTSARAYARSTSPKEIQFKYQPQDFSAEVGSAWSSSTGQNRAQPIIQFSHGEQIGYSFTMRLFAQNKDDDIQEQFDMLILSCQKDDDLKRPPRWQFIWGSFLDETVVVKSVGGIKIDGLRADGSLRSASFAISLLLYVSVDVALVSEDRPTNTFYSVTKAGETWESIAAREYDEPAYGDILRQANPKILFPGQQPGKIVMLPKIENIRGTVIEPSSTPLQRTAAGLALRGEMFAARSVTRQSTVLKK